MTAKTLEKVPVNIGSFVHPDSVYSVDDIAAGLPTSVAIFPGGDIGAHYDQVNVAAGKKMLARFVRCLPRVSRSMNEWGTRAVRNGPGGGQPPGSGPLNRVPLPHS